ncbi:hypothetical protein METBIDRAFT_38925 [Metschnikowia bicuspidata var. bicuspidata NRRL YB-4993]|uniref:DNA-directed RNA polymerase III subunit RPC3 n=1 Tax=Metschnikowia bicuspidata var. bicuspidata NRRL YB-4993 TaxID=869754 RepID=A0A1A0HD72_9ASCO|nr:hypothetical protein METBIDRAFT_38925 [Metschnikowia bicuspidata var. bicuspidata NRRL YB-4993]OBA22029.1 hypothetical protein METBIDRAFT_38925 [Metschnikowia bicuspidata var. bicuspidata NRRL YB-4993]
MASPHTNAAQTQSPQSFLYTCLASNHLGAAAAAVVASLISHGRLSARELAAKTRLPPRQVRGALVSLIQLNCVQYWAEPAGVHYSFCAQGLDVLLHGGDIICHVKETHGADAAEAVQNVLQHGSMAVHDYMSSFADPHTQAAKMAVLVRLYGAGWLRRLQPVDLLPPEDLWARTYRDMLQHMPRSAATSEIKRVAEAREKTQARMLDLYASGTAAADVYTTNNGVRVLRADLVLTIHWQRYLQALRSRAFVALARLRLGVVSAHVYAAGCALVEQRLPELHLRALAISGLVLGPDDQLMLLRLRENALVDAKQTVFSVRDVARRLPPHLDLRNSILTQNFLKPGRRAAAPAGPPPKRIKREDGAAPDVALAPDALDNDSADLHPEALVAEHLRLLAACKTPFVVETAPGSYTVPFLQVARAVKQHHYDALVKATLGPNALRVLRCVQTMRLVDEKLISNAVLLKDRTVKNEVYKLVTNNVLEIQEVPRSVDRAALKTFYLFRHKPAPCHAFVARSLLHSMGAVLSNVDLFRADHRILLDKCEREDVKGHEDELLLDSELKTLRDLQRREVANIGRFNRLKWLHFIFGCL